MDSRSSLAGRRNTALLVGAADLLVDRTRRRRRARRTARYATAARMTGSSAWVTGRRGWGGGFRLGRGVPDGERVLDRRQRRFRRVLDLLRGVRHVGRRLALRWTRAAAGTVPDRATSAFALRCLRIPLGQPAVTRRADIPLPLGYPIGLAERRKLLVKVSLIIVNGRPGWQKHRGARTTIPQLVTIDRVFICPVTLRPACGRAGRNGAISSAE